MRIGQSLIKGGGSPFIIAEIGVNHDGCAERAFELVEYAASAGADAVKFQFFEAERLLSRAALLADYQRESGASDPFAMLKSLELPIEALGRAAERARALGLEPIITIFSVELVGLAEQVNWSAYKSASPDIINRPLIEAMAATGRPLILSTGASILDEVERALGWVGDHPHAVLHCVSAYPTPPESAALGGIAALKRVTSVPVGYSDHTPGIETGALAVSAGAAILEKHLTYDRFAPGPDHAASLDPAQFAEYVRRAHDAWACGVRRTFEPVEKRILTIEEDVRRVSRQSLVTTRSLKAGDVIRRDDLTIKRPGTGIEPWRLEEIIGCTVARDIDMDMPLDSSSVAMPAPQPRAHSGLAASLR